MKGRRLDNKKSRMKVKKELERKKEKRKELPTKT